MRVSKWARQWVRQQEGKRLTLRDATHVNGNNTDRYALWWLEMQRNENVIIVSSWYSLFPVWCWQPHTFIYQNQPGMFGRWILFISQSEVCWQLQTFNQPGMLGANSIIILNDSLHKDHPYYMFWAKVSIMSQNRQVCLLLFAAYVHFIFFFIPKLISSS